MGEFGGIDSFGGRTMPKAYSADIRMWVIARVEGGASRREAAEQLDISASAAVKWVKCFHETGVGSQTARREHVAIGGACSWLLILMEEAAGSDEGWVVLRCTSTGSQAVALRCGASSSATTSASKKSLRAAEQDRPDVARARRCWKRRQAMLETRTVFMGESSANTNGPVEGRCPRGERLVGCVPQGHWKTLTS